MTVVNCECSVCDCLRRLSPTARKVLADELRDVAAVFNVHDEHVIKQVGMLVRDPARIVTPSDLKWARGAS